VLCYKCRQLGHIAANCPNVRDINELSWDEIQALMVAEASEGPTAVEGDIPDDVADFQNPQD
jgi:hypothetical protein